MAATAVDVTKFTTEFASLMQGLNPDGALISSFQRRGMPPKVKTIAHEKIDAIQYVYRELYTATAPNFLTLISVSAVNSVLITTDGQVSKYVKGDYQKVEGLTEEQKKTASTIADLFKTSSDFFATINEQFFSGQTKTIGSIKLTKDGQVAIYLFEPTTARHQPIFQVLEAFAKENADLGLEVTGTKGEVKINLPKGSMSEQQEKLSQLVSLYSTTASDVQRRVEERRRQVEKRESQLAAERRVAEQARRAAEETRRIDEGTRRTKEVAGLATAVEAFNQLAEDLVREEASNHPVITELSRQFTEALADYKTLKTDKAGFQAAMESAFTYAQDNETAINQNRHLKQALLNIAICLTFPISLPIIGVCALATGKSFASFFRSEPTAAEQKRDDVKTQFDHVGCASS